MANNITYANKVALNENPSVADINKVKADDMNEIKQVVNETILNLLFGVGTNTWSSSDTYSINEVVIYDYLLYANITGTNTTTPPNEDTTNWQQISLLTNNMVRINKDLCKSNIAFAKSTTTRNYTNGTKITLDEFYTNSKNITFNNNNIIIGKGISKILVSAYVSIRYNAATSKVYGVDINLNDNSQISSRVQKSIGQPITSNVPPYLLDVTENDEICLKFITDVTGTDVNGVYITIEVIE